MTERWLPVVGYESRYEVSDLGRVRSRGRGKREGCLLAIFVAKARNGHRVWLANTQGRKLLYVHILVLTAFVGPRPSGTEGYHKNDGLDDSLENLEWRIPEWHGPSRVGRRDRRRHLRLTLAGWWAAERKDESPILPEEPRTPEPGWHITPVGLAALATSKHEPPPAA